MEWIVYFVGFLFINLATDIGVPKEHRVKLFSQAGLWQQVLIILGVTLINHSHILK